MFDHEKLDVYHLELQFIAWVTPLIEEARKTAAEKSREVRDQLDRASLSALLNTAEGNGKRQRPVRAKFFDDARGSATECAGCLDALVAKGVFTEVRIAEGKALLVRIVSILCKLIARFETGDGMLREEEVEYRVGDGIDIRRDPHAPRTRTRRSTRTKAKY
jgi:four helix bundle protein